MDLLEDLLGEGRGAHFPFDMHSAADLCSQAAQQSVGCPSLKAQDAPTADDMSLWFSCAVDWDAQLGNIFSEAARSVNWSSLEAQDAPTADDMSLSGTVDWDAQLGNISGEAAQSVDSPSIEAQKRGGGAPTADDMSLSGAVDWDAESGNTLGEATLRVDSPSLEAQERGGGAPTGAVDWEAMWAEQAAEDNPPPPPLQFAEGSALAVYCATAQRISFQKDTLLSLCHGVMFPEGISSATCTGFFTSTDNAKASFADLRSVLQVAFVLHPFVKTTDSTKLPCAFGIDPQKCYEYIRCELDGDIVCLRIRVRKCLQPSISFRGANGKHMSKEPRGFDVTVLCAYYDPQQDRWVSSETSDPFIFACWKKKEPHKPRNEIGTPGVYAVRRKGKVVAWAAEWRKETGKSGYKQFAITEFGHDGALENAIKYRLAKRPREEAEADEDGAARGKARPRKD